MTSVLESRPCSGGLRGKLAPPGDKSMSHRALILGALARGPSRIEGLLQGDDVLATASALSQLGVGIRFDGDRTLVEGHGESVFRAPKKPLDMGNSGTAMRLLAGVLAAQPFSSELRGDASLGARPMRRIMEPLRAMGADISGTAEGTAPLLIRGRALSGLDYASPVASAQVKSCVLLAGLFAEGKTRVREPLPSRDHTERMLGLFGAPLDDQGWVYGGSILKGARFRVPADVSSAAFPLAAALLVPGSDLELGNVGLNPTRTGLLNTIREMGGDIEVRQSSDSGFEPAGVIRVRYGGRLKAVSIGGEQVPAMVDEIPILMALAAMAEGVTSIRGAAELRVKESDRLAVMGSALVSLGVGVRLVPDGVDIEGVERLVPAGELQSAGDHRCAMSLAVLGLCTPAGVRVRQAEFIATSYPGFVEDMGRLGADMNMVAAA